MRQILYIVFILTLSSCSTDKSQDSQVLSDSAGKGHEINNVNRLSVEISPEKASRDSILTLNVKGFLLSDSKIEWLVNGNPVANPDLYQFKAAELKKGDTVQAIAAVKDKKILSSIVQIGNAPPQVESVKIIPEMNKVSVEAMGSDTDGNPVRLTYEWTKNGKLAGTENSIVSDFKRGDKFTVKITPFDGEEHGQPVVIEREIQNSAPVITEHKNYSYAGGIFTYNVQAMDPDGDELAYALKTSPQGMMVDKATGVIRWEIPFGFTGKASFTVSVSDGYGGETTQQFTFRIAE